MALVRPTSRVYHAAKPLGAMYRGDTKVWEPVPPPPSIPMTGLTVWITAEDYTGSAWPNRGSAPAPSIVGSPPMTLMPNALNGNPVVRFTASEGRVRGTGATTYGAYDLTLLYVARQWGSHVGRIFSNVYPPFNFLVGAHTVGEPVMYDNGWVGPQPGWSVPTPWKIYGCVCTGTPGVLSTFYVNGVIQGGPQGGSAGHDTNWGLSGYDATATQETCDCEVAELVIYNRPLSDPERQQVETYLRTKWGL